MKLDTFKPLHDRVVIKRLDVEEKTPCGLLVPTESKEKPVEGEVVAVGDGKPLDDGTTRKLKIEVGHRVLFGKYTGSEVKIGGQDFTVMREDEILGFFTV
jgi:chaperonin GroES